MLAEQETWHTWKALICVSEITFSRYCCWYLLVPQGTLEGASLGAGWSKSFRASIPARPDPLASADCLGKIGLLGPRPRCIFGHVLPPSNAAHNTVWYRYWHSIGIESFNPCYYSWHESLLWVTVSLKVGKETQASQFCFVIVPVFANEPRSRRCRSWCFCLPLRRATL